MRALPAVEPHVERGHTFRSEYAWQETHCRTRGHHKPLAGCSCSEYHRLRIAAEPFHRLSGRYPDQLITSREALALMRPYLPWIRTEADLYRALAWSPVKVLLRPRPRSCYYTDTFLLVWAKAKAAGKPAPWEAARKRAA